MKMLNPCIEDVFKIPELQIGENVIIAGLKTFIEKQRNRGINDKESKL